MKFCLVLLKKEFDGIEKDGRLNVGREKLWDLTVEDDVGIEAVEMFGEERLFDENLEGWGILF